MYVTEPNSAKPTMKPTRLATLKTRLRKSESGRIGSLATLSASTNPTDSATPQAISATIGADPHAYVEPPRLVYSTIAVSPPASSAIPR